MGVLLGVDLVGSVIYAHLQRLRGRWVMTDTVCLLPLRVACPFGFGAGCPLYLVDLTQRYLGVTQ